MNYLILTPDGVGSTILQRLVTITLYIENHPVTNTHELTNGLELKNGIAIKNPDYDYSQSLDEIINIVKTSDDQTALVSRLAKYHLDNRKDPIKNCQIFYDFLNKHFIRKIACVRENIFEYAMSWSIRNQSGILNVYSKQDRNKVSQVSEVDEEFFMQKCNEYVKYVEWIEDNFPGVEKVSYENIVKDSDMVMQKITGYQNTFVEKFGAPLHALLYREHDFLKNKEKDSYPKDYIRPLAQYKLFCDEMLRKGIIMGVPLKNTTLTDKKNQIKNFNNCLKKFYTFAKNHNWIDQSKATYDFWYGEHIC